MIDCYIPDVGNVQFNPEDVPTFYQWSGYVYGVDEYKAANFLLKQINDTVILICSSENGVGLCEYLSRYIIKLDFLTETENLLSPSCDYWFLKAWEMCEQEFDNQDWFKRIVQIFIDQKMIQPLSGEESTFFCLIGLDQYETSPIVEGSLSDIKKICEETLETYFQDYLEQYDDLEEAYEVFLDQNPSLWANSIFQKCLTDFKNT